MQRKSAKNMLARAALLSIAMLSVTLPAAAQRVRSTGFAIDRSSSMVFLAGTTQTAMGKTVEFKAITAGEEVTGYQYAKAGIESLQPGERLPLFIRGLRAHVKTGEGCVDASGDSVSGCITAGAGRGAWKVVEIAANSASGAARTISFKEPVNLGGGKTDRLVLTLRGDWFSDRPAASKAAGKPPAK